MSLPGWEDCFDRPGAWKATATRDVTASTDLGSKRYESYGQLKETTLMFRRVFCIPPSNEQACGRSISQTVHRSVSYF